MKIISFFFLFMAAISFVKSVVADASEIESASLACRMGESTLDHSDYPADTNQESEFFTNIAEGLIKKIIINQPFDQKGTSFVIKANGSAPKLSGYIVIKESYQQINLATANCSNLMGNDNGFEFECEVINPADNQKLYLNYLFKNKIMMGSFSLKVSRSKIALLAKNLFACSRNENAIGVSLIPNNLNKIL